MLQNSRLRAQIRNDGSIARLDFLRKNAWEEVQFRNDIWRGPAIQVTDQENPTPIALTCADQVGTYTGAKDGVKYSLTYALDPAALHVTARVENTTPAAWQPQRASLCLGIDTYMATYPEWRNLYFPSLLRCEPTHFWGYLMNPNGRILAMGSKQPVASWQHHYEPGAHRIFTSSLDLLESAPLPPRHPQGLSSIPAGAAREWKITLFDATSLASVKPELAQQLTTPMIDCSRHTGEPGGKISLTIHGGAQSVTFTPPGGCATPLPVKNDGKGNATAELTLPSQTGEVKVVATNTAGRRAEALLNVRRPWSWILKKARSAAIHHPQKGSSHCEAWYGLYSAYLARLHFPDPVEDAAIDAKFGEIYPLMYDPKSGLPTQFPERLQNHSAMAGLLADRYLATGETESLEKAATLCDFLITRQGKDGAYYNSGKHHYTSVIYVAKSILEVAGIEKSLAKESNIWQQRHDRHMASALRAIDDLANRLDNVGTEGQATFEDGMISCSATQLALAALLEPDPAKRARYTADAEFLMDSHRCLTQQLIPDARMHAATLRFWEGQYDIMSRSANYMNSAHGWSAWRIYGLWYLYQLTHKVEYLREAMDALGTCTRLINPDNGTLSWSFMPDPRVHIGLLQPAPGGTRAWTHVHMILGECDLPMISHWYTAPPNTWVGGHWGDNGGCCDNDVHEIFKCLEEVALTSAYAVFHEDGSLETWNCRVDNPNANMPIIRPSETCVTRVHVHTKRAREFTVLLPGGPITRMRSSPGWLTIPQDTKSHRN